MHLLQLQRYCGKQTLLSKCHLTALYAILTHTHTHTFRPGSEAMYGFSKLACSLNEPEEGVAPTDCRLRPDVRTMEQQDFDGANAAKVCILPILSAVV